MTTKNSRTLRLHAMLPRTDIAVATPVGCACRITGSHPEEVPMVVRRKITHRGARPLERYADAAHRSIRRQQHPIALNVQIEFDLVRLCTGLVVPVQRRRSAGNQLEGRSIRRCRGTGYDFGRRGRRWRTRRCGRGSWRGCWRTRRCRCGGRRRRGGRRSGVGVGVGTGAAVGAGVGLG